MRVRVPSCRQLKAQTRDEAAAVFRAPPPIAPRPDPEVRLYTTLRHSAPHYTLLHYTTSPYTTLHPATLHSTPLYHSRPLYTTLDHSTPPCTSLHHFAPLCSTLHPSTPLTFSFVLHTTLSKHTKQNLYYEYKTTDINAFILFFL